MVVCSFARVSCQAAQKLLPYPQGTAHKGPLTMLLQRHPVVRGLVCCLGEGMVIASALRAFASVRFGLTGVTAHLMLSVDLVSSQPFLVSV